MPGLPEQGMITRSTGRVEDLVDRATGKIIDSQFDAIRCRGGEIDSQLVIEGIGITALQAQIAAYFIAGG